MNPKLHSIPVSIISPSIYDGIVGNMKNDSTKIYNERNDGKGFEI